MDTRFVLPFGTLTIDDCTWNMVKSEENEKSQKAGKFPPTRKKEDGGGLILLFEKGFKSNIVHLVVVSLYLFTLTLY